MFTGEVKWFSTKGEAYGYITYENGEVFVHYKGLLDEGQENPRFKCLKPGQKVRFEVIEGHLGKGTQAINVVVLKNDGIE